MSTERLSAAGESTAAVGLFVRGTIVDRRYEIGALCGSGGSAHVYEAHDLLLNTTVALKVLRADRFTGPQIGRFRREARIARGANSPRLVRIYDIGEGEFVYLAMELLRGGSLRARMQSGPLSIDEAIGIAEQIAAALADLHALRIVHRDLKPANLLIDADGNIRLADFGLARHAPAGESQLTETGAIVGTIDYIAPEQALGDPIDHRADLYSFGVLLFEMLTGELPFAGSSSVARLAGHLHVAPRDVRQLRPATPRWLARLVHRLLRKEPARRYATAKAVLRDLQRRRARRPWPFAATVIAMLALAAAIAMWLAWTHRTPRLVRDGSFTVHAVASNGEVLWKRGDMAWAGPAIVRRGWWRSPLVAAVLTSDAGQLEPRDRVLSLLDARTGQPVLRTPMAAPRFRGFSDMFGPNALMAADLDGDGWDEVAVTFVHSPYYPSYTDVYDVRRDQTWSALVASGHQHVGAIADVDGDGTKELLFAGVNNLMGWNTAVAAVSLPIGRGAPETYAASTPDSVWTRTAYSPLEWYALTPPGPLPVDHQLSVDETRHVITLNYAGARHDLGFDGFTIGSHSKLAPAARAAERTSAYAHLREALRLDSAMFPAEALSEARAATVAARNAGDAVLTEWSTRIEGRMLVRTGRLDEANAFFDRISRGSAARADIAWDAGRAFQLAGALDRALAWYHRGNGPGGVYATGRLKYEFLEGAVLALVEQRRWDDALAEVARHGATYPEEGTIGRTYVAYIEWRRGNRTTPPALSAGSTDLQRYWDVEIRTRNGEDPQGLLTKVDALLPGISSPMFFHSVRAELLHRLGRNDEAARAARTAWEETSAAARDDVAARAHLPLVLERYQRIGRGDALSHDPGR